MEMKIEFMRGLQREEKGKEKLGLSGDQAFVCPRPHSWPVSAHMCASMNHVHPGSLSLLPHMHRSSTLQSWLFLY
jgi:hypothetical protein